MFDRYIEDGYVADLLRYASKSYWVGIILGAIIGGEIGVILMIALAI